MSALSCDLYQWMLRAAVFRRSSIDDWFLEVGDVLKFLQTVLDDDRSDEVRVHDRYRVRRLVICNQSGSRGFSRERDVGERRKLSGVKQNLPA